MATWVSWPFDVTIISFCIRETPKRILYAADTPPIRVRIEIRDGAHHANERNCTMKNVAHESQSEACNRQHPLPAPRKAENDWKPATGRWKLN
jgi:hypothetical protein